ncbi:MAG: hypothetical protein RIS76_4699, partial [Verrucomicrobiota bacterium]
RSASAFSVPPAEVKTVAAVSDNPNGDWPENVSLARPSQKFRKLNTALITDGAFRSVTRRTFSELAWNTESRTSPYKFSSAERREKGDGPKRWAPVMKTFDERNRTMRPGYGDCFCDAVRRYASLD